MKDYEKEFEEWKNSLPWDGAVSPKRAYLAACERRQEETREKVERVIQLIRYLTEERFYPHEQCTKNCMAAIAILNELKGGT